MLRRMFAAVLLIPVLAHGEAPMLKPCPDSPNCVSSQAAEDSPHYAAPFSFQGDARSARRRLIDIITSLPRTTIVAEDANYIHAEFRSRIFGFVDDVEFAIRDATHTIDVRSASRSGYYDFGVNRRRVDTLRRRFAGGEQ